MKSLLLYIAGFIYVLGLDFGEPFSVLYEKELIYRIVQVFLLSLTRLSFILSHSLKIVPLSLMFSVPSFHSK